MSAGSSFTRIIWSSADAILNESCVACLMRDLLRQFRRGREDEQVELVVEEPLDGVRAVSGFSNTKHGDSTLRGLITPEGLLYLYKVGF